MGYFDSQPDDSPEAIQAQLAVAKWQWSLFASGAANGPEIDIPITGIADHPHVINVAEQVAAWQAAHEAQMQTETTAQTARRLQDRIAILELRLKVKDLQAALDRAGSSTGAAATGASATT